MNVMWSIWYLIITGFLIGIAYADFFAFDGTLALSQALLLGTGFSLLYKPLAGYIGGFNA